MPLRAAILLDFVGVMYWLLSAPLAVAALLAIPYTIVARRRRRAARRAQIGPEGPDLVAFEEVSRPVSAESSEDRYLWVRLTVAFGLCVALAWLCYRVLPRVGVDVPWWVPVLCFGVILVTMLVRRGEERREARAEADERGVVGRIGPGSEEGPP